MLGWVMFAHITPVKCFLYFEKLINEVKNQSLLPGSCMATSKYEGKGTQAHSKFYRTHSQPQIAGMHGENRSAHLCSLIPITSSIFPSTLAPPPPL